MNLDDLTAEDPGHKVVIAGRAIRVPRERSAWPPHCIFAAIYASTLLTSWSAQDFLTQVRSHWYNSFYLEAQRSRDEAKCKAGTNSDNKTRQVDVFDVLLMLREMASHNAVHNAPLSES